MQGNRLPIFVTVGLQFGCRLFFNVLANFASRRTKFQLPETEQVQFSYHEQPGLKKNTS